MRALELPPRLRLIAGWVPEGAYLADVGTDHGYLPTWLRLQGKIRGAVASDLRPDRYLGRLLRRLVKADISVISMHTNLDIAPGGVNDALAEALRIEDPGPMPGDETGLCRVGRLRNSVKLSDFAADVCKALHANGVRYAGDRPVEYIAVGGGACGDEIDAVIAAGCDTFVTSDLTYHQFLDTTPKGINLIDAGHFPTEDPVCAKIVAYLEKEFPQLIIIKSTSHKEVIQYFVEGE